MDLAPIQVQLLPAPQPLRMRPALSRRAANAVVRHRRAAGLFVCAGLAAGGLVTLLEPPVYVAIAVVQTPGAEAATGRSLEFKESAATPDAAADRANAAATQWIETRRDAQQQAAAPNPPVRKSVRGIGETGV